MAIEGLNATLYYTKNFFHGMSDELHGDPIDITPDKQD